jgi:polygalacturonase
MMIALVYSRESMGRLPIFVLALLAAICRCTACAAEIDVNSFGAKGDGTSVDTAAIQKALDEAAKTKGTRVFHPGIYLTGSIFVKSNTQLRVDEGVELRGLQDLAAYPMMPTRVAGIEMKWQAALINVYEQSNVQISGKGVVDGDGRHSRYRRGAAYRYAGRPGRYSLQIGEYARRRRARYSRPQCGDDRRSAPGEYHDELEPVV